MGIFSVQHVAQEWGHECNSCSCLRMFPFWALPASLTSPHFFPPWNTSRLYAFHLKDVFSEKPKWLWDVPWGETDCAVDAEIIYRAPFCLLREKIVLALLNDFFQLNSPPNISQREITEKKQRLHSQSSLAHLGIQLTQQINPFITISMAIKVQWGLFKISSS